MLFQKVVFKKSAARSNKKETFWTREKFIRHAKNRVIEILEKVKG